MAKINSITYRLHSFIYGGVKRADMGVYQKGDGIMGGNYQKDIYRQLMEVMSKVDSLKSGQKQDRKVIRSLTGEVVSLRKENAALREEVSSLKQEITALKGQCDRLTAENTLLRNDNERMKRTLNNDSSNSSDPPSKDEDTKPTPKNMWK